MGDKLSLSLDERTVQGKKVAGLRKDGIVPAVVYGPGVEPVAVQIAANVMEKLYRQAGTYTPVHITVAGKKRIAMIKEVDHDPVKGTIRHVSFHAVKASDPVVAEVPIQLDGEGESEAEKNGLIVLQTIDKIEVRALPMDLPDALHADIRGLKEPGEKLLLSDVTLPEKVELVEHESGHGDEDEEQHSVTELVIASVWEPSALQAANEAAAGDAEDESEVESENGEDTDQTSQAEETMPGGKAQDEPKQSNVDANK
ncbi:50S ribosomal protein L25 [Candidatus Saccharibacteria bacterium RAAC3_TM7_1]|nr:50S ribosomal protein L25 [Candidatus Saccharibacteria bacterium RAAC3_TM7_1]HCZ28327.1 50S ribosomal protein L25 [Candidatus Saccharibacteria bacterium]